MIQLGILGFLIGSCFFVGMGILWYFKAKWEYEQEFHALCPETLEPVDIRVDGAHAARTRLAGCEELVVTSCTRWPEKQGCDQGCTPQVPLLGDSRVDQQYTAFGLQPHQLKRFTPVHMTKDVYNKLMAQVKRQHPGGRVA